MRRLTVCIVAIAVLTACGGGGGEQASTRRRPRTTATTTTTMTAPTTTASTTPPNLAAVSVMLTKVADVSQGTALVSRPGDPALYVARQNGEIVALHDARVTPVLDVSRKTRSGGEEGLLGIAFSADGSRLYVHSTALNGDTRVEEYAFVPASGGGGRADPASARLILTAPAAQSNHNGGELTFGPDGMLYLGLGDGGGGGGNGQSRDTLLGKILRIDPTPSSRAPYTIPPDNPFAKGGGRSEIWAYGLRNPWRFSFDEPTGTIWIADVGQNAWEEIDALAVSASRGANFGWNPLEGTHEYRGGAPPGTVMPIFETSHADGNCSITGGYVYRGSRIPALRGAYVFSDYCNGAVRAIYAEGGRVVQQRELGVSASSISSFGVDNDGELYVVSQDEGIYRLDPA